MFLLKQKIEKIEKSYLKICKNLTNPQNTKTQTQTNISIFCKSNNELNALFQRIYNACNNIPLMWGVTSV